MDNDLYFKNDTYMRESHDQSKNCTMNLSIQNSGEINFTQGNKIHMVHNEVQDTLKQQTAYLEHFYKNDSKNNKEDLQYKAKGAESGPVTKSYYTADDLTASVGLGPACSQQKRNNSWDSNLKERSQIHPENFADTQNDGEIVVLKTSPKINKTSDLGLLQKKMDTSPQKEVASKKRRSLKALNRVPWSAKEKRVTLSFFLHHLQNRKLPRKTECESCLERYSNILKNRSWLHVKNYIRNQITRLNRKS